MTILDLWYLIEKSFKNFTGGKENVSAIADEIIKVTKTLIVQAMSSPSSWIWAIDNISKFLLHLKEFYWLSTWQHLLTFIHLRYLLPYVRHYKPRLVFFFTQFSLWLRLILQTIYVLKMEILHFLSSKSAAYKRERLQIESGLWWRAYGTYFDPLCLTDTNTY